MSDRIIVTGAAGFIGRNVVQALNERGETNLFLVDQLGVGSKWKNLLGLTFEDLVQPDAFRDMVSQGAAPHARAVIHLGACSATTEQDADYLLENNYRYTRALCQWALGAGIRFIYASSAATYGDGSQGYSDSDALTPELRPLNMYGYSKHMFDLWALREGLLDQIVGLKYFNVYGPFEDHKGEMRSVVHKAYHQILETGRVKLFKSDLPDYADGDQKRDFIYVRDAVDVTLWFLNNNVGGLYNCGTGEARTWNDLITALFQSLDRPVQIDYVQMPENLRGKYQYFTQAEISKLRDAGYDSPFARIEEGVADYVQSHLVCQH